MYRNSQTRYYGDYIYSVTCNTYKKVPFFRKKEFCDIFLNVLYNTKRLKQFELYAFCLNHDHFHILLRPNESVANISQIMQALKKNISQDINKKILGHTKVGNNLFPIDCRRDPVVLRGAPAKGGSELAPAGKGDSFPIDCRREFEFAPAKGGSELVPAGKGDLFPIDCRRDPVVLRGAPATERIDSLNEEYKNIKLTFSNGEKGLKSFKFQWQKSFHDHIIRNEGDFIEHLKYIEYNYLKHNLPENRQYTSLNNKKMIDFLNFN